MTSYQMGYATLEHYHSEGRDMQNREATILDVICSDNFLFPQECKPKGLKIELKSCDRMDVPGHHTQNSGARRHTRNSFTIMGIANHSRAEV